MSLRSDTPLSSSWQFHLRGWQSSGQTQAAYCREHDLAYCQFTYWKQKLAQEVAPAQCNKRSGLVPVHVIDGQSAGLTICLPSGATIEGIDEENCQLARDLATALL